jgi:hypothetical protein
MTTIEGNRGIILQSEIVGIYISETEYSYQIYVLTKNGTHFLIDETNNLKSHKLTYKALNNALARNAKRYCEEFRERAHRFGTTCQPFNLDTAIDFALEKPNDDLDDSTPFTGTKEELDIELDQIATNLKQTICKT